MNTSQTSSGTLLHRSTFECSSSEISRSFFPSQFFSEFVITQSVVSLVSFAQITTVFSLARDRMSEYLIPRSASLFRLWLTQGLCISLFSLWCCVSTYFFSFDTQSTHSRAEIKGTGVWLKVLKFAFFESRHYGPKPAYSLCKEPRDPCFSISKLLFGSCKRFHLSKFGRYTWAIFP